MAGLYIHIPFCKRRCIYCGFYSTERLALQERYVEAAIKELSLRKGYLSEPISTVYIGGGTPSCLQGKALERLLSAINAYNNVNKETGIEEFTVECNPDDVTDELVKLLKSYNVSRISLGAQTFNDERLKFIHRRHDRKAILSAVKTIKHCGITNISIDLMYGFPDETLKDWDKDISEALSLDIKHISAYCLTYEEGTALYRLLEQNKVSETDEETERKMYFHLINRLEKQGFEQYELSNFAIPGFQSKHNAAYWTGKEYLGIGASAHSFDKNSRQWNVSDLASYIQGIEQGEVPSERETLSLDNKFNETIMTALRTRQGISIEQITENFPKNFLDDLLLQAKKFITTSDLIQENGRLRLTKQALFKNDFITRYLIRV